LLSLAQSLLPLRELGGQKYIDAVLERAIEAFRKSAKLSSRASIIGYAQGSRPKDERAFLNKLAEVWRAMGDVEQANAVEQLRGAGAAARGLRGIVGEKGA
jgi:hypothetical protein